MQCPQCNSDNTQKLSVVYEHGTQNIQTTGRTYGSGVGLGRGGFGVGLGSSTTSTKGKSQSIAAKNAAPPDKKKIIIPLALMGAGLFTAFAIHGITGLLLVAVGGFIFWKFSQYNSNTYPPLMEQWQRSWLCNWCGSMFTL